MKCPKCNIPLEQLHYEGVEIDRCSECQSVWLDEGELERIISTEEETFSPEMIQKTVASTKAGVPLQEQKNHVPCPKCQAPMKSFNYAYESGVVLDRCPKNHGLWFDGEELEKVQIYRENLNKEADKHRAKWAQMASTAKVNAMSEREQWKDEYASNFFFSKLLKMIL